MTVRLMAPKSSPADIAARVLEGIASGTEDILADGMLFRKPVPALGSSPRAGIERDKR
jgi:hypothetical protein